ncbi:hypothetical protein DFJ74DRAFT_684993, partial [Hyaloraphidium curvatum]
MVFPKRKDPCPTVPKPPSSAASGYFVEVFFIANRPFFLVSTSCALLSSASSPGNRYSPSADVAPLRSPEVLRDGAGNASSPSLDRRLNRSATDFRRPDGGGCPEMLAPSSSSPLKKEEMERRRDELDLIECASSLSCTVSIPWSSVLLRVIMPRSFFFLGFSSGGGAYGSGSSSSFLRPNLRIFLIPPLPSPSTFIFPTAPATANVRPGSYGLVDLSYGSSSSSGTGDAGADRGLAPKMGGTSAAISASCLALATALQSTSPGGGPPRRRLLVRLVSGISAAAAASTPPGPASEAHERGTFFSMGRARSGPKERLEEPRDDSRPRLLVPVGTREGRRGAGAGSGCGTCSSSCSGSE